MSEASVESQPHKQAPAPLPDPWTAPLSELNVAQNRIFREDLQWDYFARLRRDAPVHWCEDSMFGPYWSVSSYRLIKDVDENHQLFSSEPSITIFDQPEDFYMPMFIAMDRPKHDQQRKVVQPVVSPRNLAGMEDIIRSRLCDILDNLPIGETFNWVERVSIELTTQMLATILGFPFEERAKLTRWSDITTSGPESGLVESDEQRREELIECLQYFTELWNQKAKEPPTDDMISMLVHGEATQNMTPMEYLGNVLLLIVGGNDTTRNSISGGVLALNQFPDEYAKLRANPDLIPNMVAEIIRWQTPLAHMRRTAKEDCILGGQQIKAGDKIVMWYVSGNRDDSVFTDPDRLIIDRPNARQHLSFGFGIHRCMGNRLGEMQLRILWEEVQKRFEKIEVVGAPTRTPSTFVRGYTDLPVVLHAKK